MSRLIFAVLPTLLLVAPSSPTQPPAAPVPPKLEPVAETKLLMNGLNKPNFDGLGKILKEKPTEDEAWSFARGQALLIGETGNLLMLRAPKTRPAQDAWMARAAELRDAATKLAKAAGDKDYLASRTNLAGLANACNRCHQSFRVETRVIPFEPPAE